MLELPGKILKFMDGKKSNAALLSLLILFASKKLGVSEEVVSGSFYKITEAAVCLVGVIGQVHKLIKRKKK